MNGIIGMTSLLLETALDRSQLEYAETVRASAGSLLTVINDLLDFSKIEAGKLDIELIEMDLCSSIEDVGALLAFQAAEKQLELIIDVSPDLPLRVLGDPQRLRQCLVNLLGNAIKFTPTGEIVVEVRAVGSLMGREMIRFEVRDSGIGIAPEVTPTLFQPFVQADSSTTRHFGGTGLGLSIVRRLVELMGGEVGVNSVVGQGSAFWFTLPMTATAATAAASAPDARAPDKRILLVELNKTQRRALEGQLTHERYRVELASNGADALDQLRAALASAQPFDAVLIGSELPDMDGATLGQRISSDPQLSRCSLVMLTAMKDHDDIARLPALGFAGFVSKPVRRQELVDCLHRALTRKSDPQDQPLGPHGASVRNRTAPRYAGKVLLVEDNVVNQKVGQRFLERLGCTVTLAINGAEAVAAYTQEEFKLVLMDLQMPVMDGFTATRRIREIEASRSRLPIVALTANAMNGQLERCLAVDMDGLLSKPLEIDRLRETLDRFGLRVDTPASDVLDDAAVGAVLATPRPLQSAVDLAQFADAIGDDHAFAQELVETFGASSADLLHKLCDAHAANDHNQIARAAHTMKGASANICAKQLPALCAELERSAAEGDSDAQRAQIQRIEMEMRRVNAELQQYATSLGQRPDNVAENTG